MAQRLNGKTVAILVSEGFEEEELTRPRQALVDEQAQTVIVSPTNGQVKAWDHTDWGETFAVDVLVIHAKPEDYDALVLPGGVMNPDNMRRHPHVQQFIRAFFDANKPVAAICHAPWLLIDAGVARGRSLTSYHSIQTDMKNAGANWSDEAAVVDGNLLTSRNPRDIPAFNRHLIDMIAKE